MANLTDARATLGDAVAVVADTAERVRPDSSRNRTICGESRRARQAATLARLSFARDGRIADDYVRDAHLRGASVDAICLDLLAPAAAILGQLWLEDRCSFLDVTLGTIRLQRGLRALAPGFVAPRTILQAGPSALMVPVPGEQHGFGLQMAAEFFRRDGWAVDAGIQPTMTAICLAAADRWLDMIGLSLGSDHHVDTCAELIRHLRETSKNPDVLIVIGGPLPSIRQDVASYVAADAVSDSLVEDPRRIRNRLAGGRPAV